MLNLTGAYTKFIKLLLINVYWIILGPAIIRSKKELKQNEWVLVTASRYLSEGKLIVNGEQPVSGRLPGGTKPLSLHTPLYIGGYDEERIRLNSGVGVSGGFEGCVAAVSEIKYYQS